MKIEIDTDFVLPIVVGFIAIILTIGNQTLVPKSTIDELLFENDTIFQELVVVTKERDEVTKRLEAYLVTEDSLKRLGATQIEAQRAMMASEVYGIDPKPMGAL